MSIGPRFQTWQTDASGHRQCEAREARGYFCTRRYHHAGDHIARGTFKSEGEYARWPQEEKK